MKQILTIIFALLLVASLQFGEAGSDDGPYLFWNEQIAELRWIEDGELQEKTLDFEEQLVQTIQLDFSAFHYRFQAKPAEPESAVFRDVSKFFAMSDVHGQFELMTQLLQAHQVIDEKFNWIFGEGHLVILGDIFDRGAKVTECLWLIHQLEWQAKEAGGMVHYLLGNHEIMVLNNDMRYVHESYFERTEKILQKKVSDLYAENTEFGRWLRTKNTILKLDDYLFVHGGISPEIIKNNLSIQELNKLIRAGIDKKDNRNETEKLLFGNKGPFWFRGIWQNHTSYSKLKKQEFAEIFAFYQAEKIIVGHTTMDSIVTTFQKQAIGIDSGIKRGQRGEALFFLNGTFYRALLNGVKQKI
jgi:hypothetical protein